MSTSAPPARERDAEFILDLLLGASEHESYVTGWIQEVASDVDQREWTLAETSDALEYLREHGLVRRHLRTANVERGYWWSRVA